MATIIATIALQAPDGREFLPHNVWEVTDGDKTRVVCVPKGSADVETATTNASVEGLAGILPAIAAVRATVDGNEATQALGAGDRSRVARIVTPTGVVTVTLTAKGGALRIRANVSGRAMVRTALTADERDALLQAFVAGE